MEKIMNDKKNPGSDINIKYLVKERLAAHSFFKLTLLFINE